MIRLHDSIPFLGVARALSYLIHSLGIPSKLIVPPKAAVLTAAQHKGGDESSAGPEFDEHWFHCLVVTTGSRMSGADPKGAAAGAP
jgi:hypothetical protein